MSKQWIELLIMAKFMLHWKKNAFFYFEGRGNQNRCLLSFLFTFIIESKQQQFFLPTSGFFFEAGICQIKTPQTVGLRRRRPPTTNSTSEKKTHFWAPPFFLPRKSQKSSNTKKVPTKNFPASFFALKSLF